MMKQLRDWGFSRQWWRGQKGEYWVVGQTIISIAFIVLPAYPVLTSDAYWLWLHWGITGMFGIISAVFLLGGTSMLGKNLTPLPHPKDEGTLVDTGVYGMIRHPIYSGVIFGAIAYSFWLLSLTHAMGAIIFLLFFDMKSRQEETWLLERYPGYAAYQLRVRKLIPWLY